MDGLEKALFKAELEDALKEASPHPPVQQPNDDHDLMMDEPLVPEYD